MQILPKDKFTVSFLTLFGGNESILFQASDNLS